MRERFVAYVSCPQCQKKGAAVWEENEDPIYRAGEWVKTLTRVSDGFRATPSGQILCTDCDVEAVLAQNRTRGDS
jgi:hypothetical protein